MATHSAIVILETFFTPHCVAKQPTDSENQFRFKTKTKDFVVLFASREKIKIKRNNK